uniref:Secreted protein n=1 Tax=Pristhesancus plagipennis TaxID=1955184 RepID=A0A2K8JLV5_PRIPG|nr:secreted hypothetical protein [Pristhesancus plagipennis]
MFKLFLILLMRALLPSLMSIKPLVLTWALLDRYICPSVSSALNKPTPKNLYNIIHLDQNIEKVPGLNPEVLLLSLLFF